MNSHSPAGLYCIFNCVEYWAHSDPDGRPLEQPGARWQPLPEHLHQVSKLARNLAEMAAPDYSHFHDLAEWCGLLHDYGKYTDCFQSMILGHSKGPCPHAIHGTVLAFDKLKATHVASAIVGHHAGMPDIGELREKVGKSRGEAIELLSRAEQSLPAISDLLDAAHSLEKIGTERFDLLTRMLLSCLVDADRLDTAGRVAVQSPLNAAQRLQTLLDYLEDLRRDSVGGVVRSARQQVLEDCLLAASLPNDILSLSVPTGGGKTLSAMAFALKRASLQPERFRRVIVVIPYLSIIEQNADVYARVFGREAILEHHSGSFAQLKIRNDHLSLQTSNRTHISRHSSVRKQKIGMLR